MEMYLSTQAMRLTEQYNIISLFTLVMSVNHQAVNAANISESV